MTNYVKQQKYAFEYSFNLEKINYDNDISNYKHPEIVYIEIVNRLQKEGLKIQRIELYRNLKTIYDFKIEVSL